MFFFWFLKHFECFCKLSIFHKLFSVWPLTLETKQLRNIYRLDFLTEALELEGVRNYFFKINNCFHGFQKWFFWTKNMSWHAFRNKKCVAYMLYTEIIKNKMFFSTFSVNIPTHKNKKNYKKTNFCIVAYRRLQSWATMLSSSEPSWLIKNLWLRIEVICWTFVFLICFKHIYLKCWEIKTKRRKLTSWSVTPFLFRKASHDIFTVTYLEKPGSKAMRTVWLSMTVWLKIVPDPWRSPFFLLKVYYSPEKNQVCKFPLTVRF
jgi:hypothetical protein